MNPTQLYDQLEKDFITPELSDEWDGTIKANPSFISSNYKKRAMGLVCDFSTDINKVYTAVFPSEPVMKKIIADDTHDAMLFVHHPATWDIRQAPVVFQQMSKELLAEFKKRKIAIYNLHVPLDNYGAYATSVTLAKAIGVETEKPFAPYFGALCGIFGHTDVTKVTDLQKRFQEAVGHRVSLYKYGEPKLANGTVAVVAGGGNEVEILQEVAKAKINTFVTGLSVLNDFSKPAHDFAKANKINILGGTHYSTEMFACIAMVDYFKALGLPAEFLPDQPVMEDM